MGSADFGSAKFVSKQMKARGLQKLKFYCQVCTKQCRDENGFKSHIRSSSHLEKISHVTKKDIQEYTQQFENNFLKLLRVSHGEKQIEANKFYNEFIQEKNHIHMNATVYTSLSKFIQHLGRSGLIRIHNLEDINNETIDMGQLKISYIDNSSENTLRKEKLHQLEINEKGDQEIKKRLLEQQIQKTVQLESHSIENSDEPVSLKDNVDLEEISISFSKPLKKISKKKQSKKKNVFK